MSLILTRDEILDAIERLSNIETYTRLGLCWAFDDYSGSLSGYLNCLGADCDAVFKWRFQPHDRQQRLVFLAFMLTWHDEIMEGK